MSHMQNLVPTAWHMDRRLHKSNTICRWSMKIDGGAVVVHRRYGYFWGKCMQVSISLIGAYRQVADKVWIHEYIRDGVCTWAEDDEVHVGAAAGTGARAQAAPLQHLAHAERQPRLSAHTHTHVRYSTCIDMGTNTWQQLFWQQTTPCHIALAWPQLCVCDNSRV